MQRRKAIRIGHSYVFAEVVASELRPLLHEYWFDAPDVAERESDR